jgi:hypothetical protein
MERDDEWLNEKLVLLWAKHFSDVEKLNKVKTISGTSATLTLPLEQTLMLTSSGSTNINITLPELN